MIKDNLIIKLVYTQHRNWIIVYLKDKANLNWTFNLNTKRGFKFKVVWFSYDMKPAWTTILEMTLW